MSFIRKNLGEYVFIFLIFVVGVGLSFSLYELKQHYERKVLQQNFERIVTERVQAIETVFDNSVALTDSLAAFYNAADNVQRDQFSIFAKHLLKDYPYVRFAGWVPYVKDAEREAYEKEAQKTFPNFHFQDQTPTGLAIAAKKPEYFPTYYAEPDRYSGKYLGYNVISSLPRLEALQKARATGQVAMSGEIKILATNSSGIVYYAPIYNKTDNQLKGFVSITIPLADIVDQAVKPLVPVGTNIIIHDLTSGLGEDKPALIYYSRIAKQDKSNVLNQYLNNSALKASHGIEVAGRKWKITVQAAANNFTLGKNTDSLGILFGGIIFTILLTFYMLSRARENERINKIVMLRTQELNHTKKEIESILNSTTEGVIGLDETGKVIFCNPVSLFLLGYNYGDLISSHYRETFYQRQPGATDNGAIESVKKGKKISSSSSDEVFWRADGDPLHVEYTASGIIDEGKISGAVIIFRDITKRKLNQQRLEQLAHYDQLTDVANRSLFFELLKKALPRAARTKTKLAIIYIDIDNFKPINDTMGHASGDILLKMFAQRIKSILREYDSIARIGGDEFVILADNITSADDCRAVIDRIISVMAKPFEVNGKPIIVKFSTGIALYPDDATTADDLLSAADTCMYKSKKDKTEKYFFYKKHNSQDGFTLVELSIVLVIIGLLIGGILAAQSMISTAKINSVAMQLGQFDAGVENFKTKYNYLPGDAPPFGGDGDGYISTGQNSGVGSVVNSYVGEIGNFWNNMFPEQYSNVSSTVPGGPPVINGPGKNVPLSKLGQTNSFFIASADADPANGIGINPTGHNYYAIISASSIPTGITHCCYQLTPVGTSAVSPIDLLALDKKIDDGIANAGNVIAGNLHDCGDGSGDLIAEALPNCATGASYATTSTYECTPMIRIGAQVNDLQ